MSIKIDLERAYDRLNWDFIVDTPKEIRLSSSFIDVVFNYISSSSI